MRAASCSPVTSSPSSRRSLAWIVSGVKATEQPIDTSTAAGKCFLDMLGVFAEFETNLGRERQAEGIARAKANGIYAGKGMKPSINPARVREMKAQGFGATAIANELGIGRASVYRVLERASWWHRQVSRN
jgi:DNA invertase Pin-like site-specific DNA recombinase